MASAVARPSVVATEWPLEDGTGPSILETLEHLRRTAKDELPKELTVSEEDRSTIRYDEWTELSEIPVIDLSLLQTDRAGVVKQLHKAVTEWGFFHILNHGIPLELMQKVQAQGLKFFALPPEIKKNATPEPGYPMGYMGDNSKMTTSNLHWAESLFVNSLLLDRVVRKVWPEGNEEFRDTMTKYSAAVDSVGKQLLELTAESLGLSKDFFAQHFRPKAHTVRYNFYPPCPTPMESMGARSHSDPNCITVLMLDNVGGLQIEKDGEWLAVRPIEGSLVVNIADTLHAWSNGICRSVLHRGVVNKQFHRLSVAAFLSVAEDVLISAPEELVDASHPRRYRTFTVREFISTYPSRVQARKTNGETFLREAFNIEE